MNWYQPLVGLMIPTSDPQSFEYHEPGSFGLPLTGHPGSFGFVRKNHIHEGVDLYGYEGQAVYAVETGTVVAIEHFTGKLATPPSTWWHDTMAVLIEGPTGVVVYGEIQTDLQVGMKIARGSLVGSLIPVLKVDKGRPTTMLHLELHEHGTRMSYEWLDIRPSSLRDPTEFLMNSKTG